MRTIISIILIFPTYAFADFLATSAESLLPNGGNNCEIVAEFDEAKKIQAKYICEKDYSVIKIFDCKTADEKITKYAVVGLWVDSQDVDDEPCLPAKTFKKAIEQ